MELIKSEPKTGPEAYRAAHSRVDAAMKWRMDRRVGDKMWYRADKLYRGDHWTDNDDSMDLSSDNPRERITVNLTGSMIDDYAPFLVRRNPKFILHPKPKKADLDSVNLLLEKSKLNSYLLNYAWEEYAVQSTYKAVVDDGLIYGYGVAKTGWALELAEAVNPKRHGKIEMDSLYRVNQPFARRIDPFKFFFDPSAPDRTLRTARWVAEIIFMPLSDVVSNKMFSKEIRNKIAAGSETPTTVPSFLAKGDADQEWKKLLEEEARGNTLVVLWEYWDKKFEKYYVFADGIEKPLIEEDTNKFPYLDGFFPYVDWKFVNRAGEPYGTGGIPAKVEDQQREKNRVRTTEYNHRRKYAATKFGIIQNQVDESELHKLTSDQDEVFFTKGPVDQVIRAFNPPPISSDNYRVDQTIDEDMRRLLGLDALHSGGNLPSRTSAREIDARTSLMGTKLQGRVEAVDKFALDLAGQLWKHMQHNLTSDQVVRIAGDEGQLLWESIPVEDIKGDFDFEVVSSSKEDPDPVQERQQRTQLLQILFQNAPMLAEQGMMLDAASVLKWAMEPYERPETEGFIIPIPQPPQPEQGPGGEVGLGTDDPGAVINAEQAGTGSALSGAALGGMPQIGV
jgi:hypothetical protein